MVDGGQRGFFEFFEFLTNVRVFFILAAIQYETMRLVGFHFKNKYTHPRSPLGRNMRTGNLECVSNMQNVEKS